MQHLAKRFVDHVERTALIAGGQHVLVACSGGLDSTVLLYLLRFFGAPDWRLTVAHFDHRMRAGSAADAAWLRGLCAAWDVSFHSGQATVPPGSEADARHARYEFLETTARATHADLIATAHQADDQIETVLFRILRGTGVDGLAGIPARRGHIIRPLLPFARAELADFAKQNRLGWRDDSSNQSRAFARNRIRLDVLPALEQAWPGSRESILQLAEEAGRARRSWDILMGELEKHVVTAQDASAIELARPLLLKYHPEISARLLRRLSARLIGHAPGRAGTATLAAFITAGESGSGVHSKGGLRVEREFDTIRLSRVDRGAEPDRPLAIPEPLPGSGEASIGGARYTINWAFGPAGDSPDSIAIDPAAVLFPLEIRAWRQGDRIRLPAGSKKLKKLFAERRLARHRRGAVPVLVDGKGNVLWVAGLVRAVITPPPADRSVLCITVRDGKSD